MGTILLGEGNKKLPSKIRVHIIFDASLDLSKCGIFKALVIFISSPSSLKTNQ